MYTWFPLGVPAWFPLRAVKSRFVVFPRRQRANSVRIPASASARDFTGRINSALGAGRYRLTIVSPDTIYPYNVDIGYDGNIAAGSTFDIRAKNEWNEARRWLLAATDGQYGIQNTANVTKDVSCFSCYDVIYSEDNQIFLAGPCIPGFTGEIGPFGTFSEIVGPFWKGTTWNDDNGNSCGAPSSIARVGETIAHEWGHYEFELFDERGSIGATCGFSLMAGSNTSDYSTGFRHFEFCDANHHGKDVRCNPTCEAPASGDSNWADLHEEGYPLLLGPEFLDPNRTPDFGQFTILGSQALTTFAGP